jgi:hypothetical protein
MSALGQPRRFSRLRGTSALPPIITVTADISDRQLGAYSMISSARPSSEGGIVNPIALAVLRLTISRNRVGSSTGRSDGFLPFRILSTNVAHWREWVHACLEVPTRRRAVRVIGSSLRRVLRAAPSLAAADGPRRGGPRHACCAWRCSPSRPAWQILLGVRSSSCRSPGRRRRAAEPLTRCRSECPRLHLYAALAEKERALISRRTKDALATPKARGVDLGGFGQKALSWSGRCKGSGHHSLNVRCTLVLEL